MRLDKLLSNMGKGSRSELVKLIKKGAVTVNSVTVKDPSFKVDEITDSVSFFGEPVKFQKFIYVMLNKPRGYVTATEDNYNKTVLDLIDNPLIKKRVAPAGRLDIDTEGFVFLTDDGDLNHYITGPKCHVRKRYLVHLELPLLDASLKQLEAGVTLDDGYVTKEAKVIPIDDDKCYMDLYEGKFHQVKRMFEAVGNKVIYLKRVIIGNLPLDEALELGEYRELNDKEIELLKEREI
ncbi:MAG: rRNA pseudouridine synthase [Ruminococcaceae bacterium]|nr:rRNA pseudouridine synthase [Oscillospiraceae bacterium]